MVRLFWVFFFLGFGLAVSAQDDPVLMRINGKEVLRSEFERSYNKDGTSAVSYTHLTLPTICSV